MKRIFIFLAFFIATQHLFGQVKIGINVSPVFGYTRVALNSDAKGYDVSSDGVGLGLIGGPELSFYLGKNQNYSIATGIWYSVKRARFTTTMPSSLGVDSNRTYNYNLQYLQLPLTFKLYTNEIATDMKLYFQVGSSLDVKIGGKEVGKKEKNTSEFQPIDASIILGAGIKYSLGENTSMLIGLRYSRGFINAVTNPERKYFKINNDMISLDLGIQF